jgi:hypothetical protein
VVLAFISIKPNTTAHAQGARIAAIPPEPLLGTWINADANTRNILRLVIMPSAGGGISVAGFGSCSPAPCVWPVVPGVVYAQQVTSDTASKASFSMIRVGGRIS